MRNTKHQTIDTKPRTRRSGTLGACNFFRAPNGQIIFLPACNISQNYTLRTNIPGSTFRKGLR